MEFSSIEGDSEERRERQRTKDLERVMVGMGFRVEMEEEKMCTNMGSLEIWYEKMRKLVLFFFLSETSESGGGTYLLLQIRYEVVV